MGSDAMDMGFVSGVGWHAASGAAFQRQGRRSRHAGCVFSQLEMAVQQQQKKGEKSDAKKKNSCPKHILTRHLVSTSRAFSDHVRYLRSDLRIRPPVLTRTLSVVGVVPRSVSTRTRSSATRRRSC
eukprot:722224-Rhodomonas_salina.1